MEKSLRRLVQRIPWLEVLLILSVLSLLLQVYGPTLVRWWNSPAPGRVGIGYLPNKFYEENPSSSLAQAYAGCLPKQYSRSEDWPLIIYLHGAGERGNDPSVLLKRNRYLPSLSSESDIKTMPAVFLLPQCRKKHGWQSQDIFQFVEHTCLKYRIDRQRIYLIGCSMGGFGTWNAAADHPDKFAAIVPIAGGASVEKAPALVAIPTWAFHGAKDKAVPVKQTTELIDAIRQIGGKPKMTIFPKAGHSIPRQVCKNEELWQWLLEQSLENRKVQSLSDSNAKPVSKQ